MNYEYQERFGTRADRVPLKGYPPCRRLESALREVNQALFHGVQHVNH